MAYHQEIHFLNYPNLGNDSLKPNMPLSVFHGVMLSQVSYVWDTAHKAIMK